MAVGTPTVGTKDEQASASASSGPTYPALSASDLLLALGVSPSTSTTTFTWTASGFTQDAQHANTGDTLAPNVVGAHRIAVGSEAGVKTFSHGSVVTSMVIVDIPGVDATTPFDPNVNSGNPTLIDISTASSNIAIPSVTVTRNGSLLLYVVSGNATTNTATPPAGWTELIDRTLASSRNWQVAYKAVNAGASGSATATWTGSQRATGLLYVIQPALVNVTGTVAVTDDTDASTTTAVLILTGTLTVTDDPDTLAATGIERLTGTLAITDGTDTLAALALERLLGTLAVTDGTDTLAASGTATQTSYTGTLAVTDANDTSAAVGIERFTGTLAATDGTDTLAGAGLLRHLGTLAVTDANDTLAALGVQRFTGTLALTDDNDTLAASGSSVSRVSGNLAVTDADDVLAAIAHIIGVNDGHPVDNPTLSLTTVTGTLTITTTAGTLELTTPQPTLELTGAS